MGHALEVLPTEVSGNKESVKVHQCNSLSMASTYDIANVRPD